MYNLVILEEFFSDVLEEVIYYETQQYNLGNILFKEIETIKNYILKNPFHFQVYYGDIRKAAINRFPFSIYYVIENKTIIIIAFVHHKQDATSFIKRI